MSLLRRYRSLVDDWTAFEAASARPLPVCVVTNTCRTTPQEVRRWLEREGHEARPVAFMPGAFQLPPEARPAQTLGHRLGLFWVQEAAATVPVALLAPRPGERLLDLCAAPGNKTAQMVSAIGDRGTVVAVDLVDRRLGFVRRAGERLGHTATCLVRGDGTSLPPDAMGRFDRVLVDVPCTCEGTSRKRPHILKRKIAEPGTWRTTTQQALLHKAIRLCRLGGRIVYATCTYAPEENEGVVDAVLASLPPGTARMLPVGLPGLRTAPGIGVWQGRRFDDGLRHALRIEPQHNDTGGFFVAVLEKTGCLPREQPAVEPATDARLGAGEAAPFFAFLEDAYGIDRERLADLAWERHQRGRLALTSSLLEPPARPQALTRGLSALRIDGALPRLTTAGALRIGRLASHNAVELHPDQIGSFFRRGPQEIGVEQAQEIRRGVPVIARSEGIALGLGELAAKGGGLTLESTLPGDWYP